MNIKPFFLSVLFISRTTFQGECKCSKTELDTLINKAEINNAVLLTTEKDYCRIDENYKKKFEFLKIELEIENKNRFIELIKKYI